MPLETASFISQLVPANPVPSDPLSNADDHIRLIKGALKATLPNWTSAALNSTNAQIDTTVTTVSNGVQVLADAGAFFTTHSQDGIASNAAGEVDIVAAASTRLSVTASGTTAYGNLTASGGSLKGPGVVPIGGMIMWLTDTLPTEGSWCWANGGVLSRTGNGAALFAIWGTTYGAGDGSTTFNVINMQEALPVGKSTMGGGSSPGLLSSISGAVKGVLGAIMGSDTHALTAAEVPQLNGATDGAHVTSANLYVGDFNFNGGGAGAGIFTNSGFIQNSPGSGLLGAYKQISLPVAIPSLSVSVNSGGGTPHSIVQPARVVNYIIRIG